MLLPSAGVDPWMGVPMWIGDPDLAGADQVDVTRALATGLSTRPIIDTVRDAWAWDSERTDRTADDSAFIIAHERDLLREWDECSDSEGSHACDCHHPGRPNLDD